MAKSKSKSTSTKFYMPVLKPVSPEINGILYPRRLIPGRELESVLTGIIDAQAILDELRRSSVSHPTLSGLCDAMTVLDAAREILAWKMSKM